MKAQRRHELQHNLLADWLGKQLEVVKPYVTWILGGVIALCALAIVLQIITGTKATKTEKYWQDFYAAEAETDLDKKMKRLAELEGSPAGLWAQLSLADLSLEQGTAKAYSDREGAKKHLEAARKHYGQVEKLARRQPLILQRAQFGLAQVYEAEEDFEKAKGLYQSLAKDAPDSVFGKSASRRLKRLESTDLKAFVAQLAAHKPPEKPKSPGLQGDSGFPGFGGLGGLGGGMPDFSAPLPERPDLSLPGPALDLPSLDAPEKTTPEEPAADPSKKPDELDKKPEDDSNKAEPTDNKNDAKPDSDEKKAPEPSSPSAEAPPPGEPKEPVVKPEAP